jgi:hypothetical protein
MTTRNRSNTLILIVGDLGIFLAFVLVGRETHAAGDPNFIINVLPTLLPFVLIWFLVAIPMGVLRPNVYRVVPRTIVRTLAAWIIAGPIAIYVRALLLSRTAIPWQFVVVTMGLNAVLLLTWHMFFAWWLRRSSR